jgi:hypothetical protein
MPYAIIPQTHEKCGLAGGDCAADLDRLEHDSGSAAVLTAIERELLTRQERRSLKTR